MVPKRWASETWQRVRTHLRRLARPFAGGERDVALLTPWTGFKAPPPPFPAAVQAFGPNPGGLAMYLYVPREAAWRNRPLVVLLHGCQQEALSFAHASGWIDAARRHRFVLVMPEQSPLNNPSRCFSWFAPEATARGEGEGYSIVQMVRAAERHLHTDRNRVFVVGLSAGAAMAASLLGAYPEVFAAGGLIAGLPAGAARSPSEAILKMRIGDLETDTGHLVARLPRHADYRGPWPRVSSWHGLAADVVAPVNAETLCRQFLALHHLHEGEAAVSAVAEGVQRRAWGRAERPSVENWLIEGFPHGYPRHPLPPAAAADPFVRPAPVDATRALLGFFGLSARDGLGDTREPALSATP